MSTSTTKATKCARCNGSASKQWFKVGGLDMGLECKQTAEDTMKATNKKGEQLRTILRDAYKEMMRHTTVTGMILIGMLSLKDMISKGKITSKVFVEIASKKYRKQDAEKIVKAMEK